MHGICPWFLTHSLFRVFCSFLESGVMSQEMLNFLVFMGEGIIMFWTIFNGILVVKVKIKGIMVGL